MKKIGEPFSTARLLTTEDKRPVAGYLWTRAALASMESIHYKSSDGLEIPAYLTLPKGVPAKGLPTLVIPHGGPWGRDVWGYNPLAGVAFTPDVYRAAVDIVGPSNLITLLEAIPPSWEAGRKIMYARMADLGTPEGKAWMRERFAPQFR